MKRKLIQYVAISLPVALLGVFLLSAPDDLSPSRKAQLEYEESERFPGLGDDHGELRAVMDVPGLTNPTLSDASRIEVSKNEAVVGIDFAGEKIAFLKEAMADTGPHVVNTVINGQPLTVSYCNLAKCVRVVTGEGDKPLELSLGGQDGNMQMVFAYKGNRFSQESKKLPFNDVPFSEVTLGEWTKLHPDSKVFGMEYMNE